MARRRKGRPIHGWLVIDKPQGLTSAAVVAAVRRISGAAKVGHGGTLDPLATGVLPVALGEATKTVSYVMDGTKAYSFTVAWGEARDTDDSEGAVTERSDVRPSAAAVTAALPSFIGTIEQLPPAYSALKVGGRRAYDLARAGQAVKLAPRQVRVDSLKLLASPDPDHACFELVCGKGTYVRALARDLGRLLGSFGHVVEMRRARVGDFSEGQAISLDKLNELRHSSALDSAILPVETALADIPALALTGPQAERLQHGQAIRVLNIADGICRTMTDGRLVALAEANDGEVRPLRVFNC
ncbi:MAG: tRNA pseudouridine(55) synthase TruB [Alphaproteobacteria bacterium]|jgi:tRNA pseudouridine55 synthase|nr:tRNA pseudouridine(55) synthase TruB [Rhodospirillaceae bacterium]MDP6407472.1 tRNA pseudouridine(55) synthase TruB [Alphaproteobacteria bacterium]MDP6622008.1 tRNA pseudouridine(55) synthase TruB [Alphaproteobacteria bacterium]|tara:strand:+ start:2372 stop:3268 length:897 start_codon:yes stop_codon:yes gene_type:complete